MSSVKHLDVLAFGLLHSDVGVFQHIWEENYFFPLFMCDYVNSAQIIKII